MEHSKNFCSKHGVCWLEVVRETCEFLLIAITGSCKASEGFSGREKNMLLPLYRTVTVPNAEYCLPVWSAVFEKGNLIWDQV